MHGYSLDEANFKVKDIILKSYETGIKKLILITGKGIHSQNEKDPYVSKDLGILKNFGCSSTSLLPLISLNILTLFSRSFFLWLDLREIS